MNKPLISIIIVVYNAEATIAAAIESVLVQSYINVELVIIDGGSTDGTINIIKNYGNTIGYFVTEKDKGIYDAMNKGIAAAKGSWVFFLGADDVLYSKEVIADLFENNNVDEVDMLYGDVEFTSKKRRFGEEKNYQKLIQQNICHQAIFYKKEIFSTIGNYDLRYKILADYDLNLRIFGNSKLIKKYTHTIVTFFNDKGSSNTIIDKNFHGDKLQHFLKVDNIGYTDAILQQYHFYFGYISLFNNNARIGMRHIVTSWLYGKQKLFYFLLTFKFIFEHFVTKKIKIR